jgi:acyl dehydratase
MPIDELEVGKEFSFEVVLTESDVDRFAMLSGDLNALHLDSGFARSRGFERRVVHGAYLVALISRLIGMHLPGPDSLVHLIQVRFGHPAYTGNRIQVKGVVDQVSHAVSAIIVKVSITNTDTGVELASGKVNVGLVAEASVKKS